jgi:hypothetical protein
MNHLNNEEVSFLSERINQGEQLAYHELVALMDALIENSKEITQSARRHAN